jgi:signal transduction histidine kinase
MTGSKITAWASRTRRWLGVSVLALLCCVLAFLQYNWTGQVSRAEKERLAEGLEASLLQLSQEFNLELARTAFALEPSESRIEEIGREMAYAERYRQWTESSRHRELLRGVALSVPQEDGTLVFGLLNFDTGVFEAVEWPESWQPLRRLMLLRLRPGPPGGGMPRMEMPRTDATTLIEIPRFRRRERPPSPPQPPPGGAPGMRLFGRESEWLILDIDPGYAGQRLLPELLQRYLGSAATDYRAVLRMRANPETVIARWPSGDAQAAGDERMDARVTLFEIRYENMFRRGFGPGPPVPGRGEPERPAPGGARGGGEPAMDSGRGRWELAVRHRMGSLDAVVQRARIANLAISAGILVLILTTIGVMLRVSQRAQRLAELQMEFVAGVSHELRTPLTVIRTAAYNLRGKLSNNPTAVERYGTLIEQESEKLTAIVEQVLRFSSAQAGQVIRDRKPVELEPVVEKSIRATLAGAEASGCTVHVDVEPALPLVMGDAQALQQAVQNLLNNAVKYGIEGGNWIGVSVRQLAEAGKEACIEIRVADKGPGIPADEVSHLFEPFFRGRRALQDQVHGTGLGLNLVKKIVEAHDGTLTVHSEIMKGTEFVIRIPIAPAEYQDEFAHTAG